MLNSMGKYDYTAILQSNVKTRALNWMLNNARACGWEPLPGGNQDNDAAVDHFINTNQLHYMLYGENIGIRTHEVLVQFCRDNNINTDCKVPVVEFRSGRL